MTRFLLLFLVNFCSEIIFAQNGISVVQMPAPFNPQQLRNKNCMSIDPGGRIWIGFQNIGAGVWDGTNWTVYDNSTFFLPDNNVQSIAFDSAAGVWVGTNAGGASRFDGVNWQLYDTANCGLPNNHIESILCTSSEIWFGTYSGIAVFNGSAWNLMNVSLSQLASDTIHALCKDLNGDIWAATASGLCRYNGNWQTMQAGNFTALACDSSGRIWASTPAMIWQQTASGFSPISQLYAFPLYNFSGAVSVCASNSGVWFTQPNNILIRIDSGEVYVYYPGNMFGISQLVASSDTGVYYMNTFTTSVATNAFDLLHFNPENYVGYNLGLTAANFRELNVNQVSAGLLNRGDLHWTTAQTATPRYEVPKGSGIHSMFTSALWIGGLDSGNTIHLAAMTYRQYGSDFFPGPIDTVTTLTDTATAWAWDKIWMTSRYDISELQWRYANGQLQSGGYIIPSDMRKWPAAGTGNISRKLAPFVDANGDGVYSVYDGDYPAIKGDQYAWWVFNDMLAPHGETRERKMGIEVHGEAWAYTCPLATDTLSTINFTTFYRFTIINRSDTNYHDVNIALYQDNDNGNWQDDWIGCSPAGNYVCSMNGDTDDSDPNYADYGIYPPQTATVFFDGPEAVSGDSIDNDNDGVIDEPGERNRLTGMLTNGNPTPFPNTAQGEHYDYLNMTWPTGAPLTVGNYGFGGTTPTRFILPDRPWNPAGWSEAAMNAPSGDRRSLSNCGVFNLAAKDTAVITFAIVTHFDSANAWGTQAYYDGLDSAVKRVERWYNSNTSPSCLQLFNSVAEPAAEPQLFLQPNPAHDQLFVQQPFGNESVTAEIIDLTGRTVMRNIQNTPVFELGVSSLPPGVYILRVSGQDAAATARFVRR
ncbi:MAG: T9SS type A sorting domain-containing protein [Bacteroidia bacterium]